MMEAEIELHSWRKDQLANGEKFKSELEDLKFAIDQATIVTTSNQHGAIIYVNDMALKIYGYSRQELMGENHRILNSGVHSKEFFRELWQTLLAGKVWRGEICNKAKNGELHWLDTTIVPFLGENGRPYKFMSIRKDISARKRIEETLEHERRKRSAIERLSAVGEMAANIAHEIRNPLTSILLQAQLLRRQALAGTLSEKPTLRGVERIESVARHMEKIIAGLLSLSRDAENDPMERVNVQTLISDTLVFCSENFDKRKISVLQDPLDKDYFIECRPAQISQVLLNLFNNARDAIESLEKPWIKISVSSSEGVVQVKVMDSGTCLTPKLRARVMEPFFTTKGNGKGTGLGLSISRKILEAHRGQLILESSQNTSFVMKLPEWKGQDSPKQ
jgi:PAS domain S-box-containing protein